MFPHDLYEQIEAAFRQGKSAAANHRGRERFRFRTQCIIRHVAQDGDHVLTKEGRTRDISRGGLGILIAHSFARGTELDIAIMLPDGRCVHLTGHVVFSRPIRFAWYLAGIKLGEVKEKRLRHARRMGAGPVSRQPRLQTSAREPKSFTVKRRR